MSYTAAHTVYALKSVLTPDIPSNAGCFRPITVTAPEGSILNCRYPAAVNMRLMTGWYCAPAIFGALAPVMPDRVQAFAGLPMGTGVYGYEPVEGVAAYGCQVGASGRVRRIAEQPRSGATREA